MIRCDLGVAMPFPGVFLNFFKGIGSTLTGQDFRIRHTIDKDLKDTVLQFNFSHDTVSFFVLRASRISLTVMDVRDMMLPTMVGTEKVRKP